MKSRHTLWLIPLFYFCFTNFLTAQDKGLIVLLIKPYNAFVKIDNQVYDLSKELFPFELELPEGQYEAQVWAPNYNIHTINLNVKANRPIQIAQQLDDFTEEYQTYQVDYKKYKTNVATDRFIIAANIGVTAGYALLMNKLNNDLDNRFANVEASRAEYTAGITEFNLGNSRNSFNFERDKYNQQQKNRKTILIAGGASLAVLYGLTANYFRKRKKTRKQKPTYESNNPFANLSFEVYPGLTIIDKSSATEFGLKWTF